ncbi:MAG: TOMM precursor leader peptide-binding protein [Chloroflexi bacterium]|nr:TOMM precursor leader peptide-binding protein [Chloroflexota bacterium]MXX99233.1 TOMM precursor leader peptide-binding protein [Chloroflexota bacterium]MYC46972.1 TOMM precursor leader peptide-binding protein [Chloroflexota bacterium]
MAAEPAPRRGILGRTTRADQGAVGMPALTPHLRFHAIAEDQALLVSEAFNTLLHGRLYCDLLPLLDGGNPQDSIVAALAGDHDAVEVRAALTALSAKGYIVSAEHGLDGRRAAWWSALGASPRWVERRLRETRVAVSGDDGRLRRHLEGAGVRVDDAGPDLAVIVCDDYLGELLADVNRRQLDTRGPWMPVQPRGLEPLFGPVFRADRDGPCWACLATRLRGHREVHGFLRSQVGEEEAFKAFATEPAVLEAVCGLVAVEIAKWLVLEDAAPVHTRAVTLNGAALETAHHPVSRRPQCRACGEAALHRPDRPAEPVLLQPSPKTHYGSGGARSIAPEATLARYRHLVSPISGVVTWLRRTTDESDPWLHVSWAGSNPGIRSRSLSSLRRSLRSKSAGKGSTRHQAEVSALCEAVERHSGVRQGDEIRVRRRFADFADGDEAIHPNDVQLFSDYQLDNAQRINADGHPYNFVPPRLDPDAEIDWTPLWSLTQERQRYLPTSMLYGMSAEHRGAADLVADSNGCAAGNTLEEAILQGFYELVERDAFAIWWYNELRVPAVDLASFGDAFLASAGDYYQRCERELWLLDVTADIAIPTFVALSRRTAGPTEDIIYGAGAHADPRTAALRAICELNQCLTFLPRPGGGAGRPMIDDPLALRWWKTARLAACPWLSPDPDAPLRTAAQYPHIESTDSRDDVERCRAIVEAEGMELLVLDQTRPDIGMPVARVVIPGMRHFWARFAPGRLYDVPVRLGRRRHPADEAELNTAPVIA